MHTRVERAFCTKEFSKFICRQVGIYLKHRITDSRQYHFSFHKGVIFASGNISSGNEVGKSNCAKSVFRSAWYSWLVSKSLELRESSVVGTEYLAESALSRSVCNSHSEIFGMELGSIVSTLNNMASPSYAGSWDNVGLLLEPSPPHTVSKLLLTNDLTPSVMQEAVNKDVNMIVSYHPPIFAPLKRVTQSSWKERIVAACLERRIALYSPHTSWDAVIHGVNDWLISVFDVKDVRPIEQTEVMSAGRTKKLTFWTSAASADTVSTLPAVEHTPGMKLYTEHVRSQGGDGAASSKVCIQCSAATVPSILAELEQHHISVEHLECSDLVKVPILGHGMGRMGQLQSPVTVQAAVSAIKSHLNLQHVRLAETADTKEVRSVAVCAGSGSSVLRGVKADLYLTGEMSHHDVLDAVCKGIHVVLCDHSNTERGYLKVLQGRLTELLEHKVQVIVSEIDRDPLVVV